jgi:glycosyltransferase involved in cell wall biosynthesis
MTFQPVGGSSVVVGIATHNRVDALRKAIGSALQQSFEPLRVAVIDDASSDGTPTLCHEFKSVSLERWERGQGYVCARNQMMLGATEDYYVSLDDDAWFIQNDEIAIAVDFLDRHPKVAAVAFDILSPDRPERATRGARRLVAMFIGCGHVLRLSAVKELGGYTEFPGTYGAEEKDLCLRLIDSGYEIVKLDGVHVWHDKSVLARDIPRQHCSGVCNDLTFVLRRVPIVSLLPVLIWKVLSHLAFGVKTGLLHPCLQGFRHFIFAAADVWRTRRPVRLSSMTRFRALTRSPVEFRVESFQPGGGTMRPNIADSNVD